MRSRTYVKAALASAALMLAAPALAQEQETPEQQQEEQQKPVTDRDPDAERVAETPLRDLNLKKDGIPPLLEAAVREPYTLDGLRGCAAIAAAVRDLDALLGPDFDNGEVKRKGITVGKVAESTVGSLIPFRGLIREVSGAASAERQLQTAILAGATRRGFLKGTGLQRGCAAPARPQA